MIVKFLAQGKNDLPLTGFEPMQLAIIILLVRRVNHPAKPPLEFISKLELLLITIIYNCPS
jgi:hypothetical protein